MSGAAVVADITSSFKSMMKLANVFVFRIQIRIRQKNEKNMKVQHFFCFGQNGQQTKFLVLTEFPFDETYTELGSGPTGLPGI